MNSPAPETLGFDECLEAVVSATEWSEEYAAQKIEYCQKRLGISYRDFLDLEMYLAPDGGEGEYFEQKMKKRARLNRARKECIAAVTEATGWTAEEALEKVDACREAYGIGYSDYRELALWDVPEAERAALCEAYLQKRRSEKRNKRLCIADAMRAMGWSEKLALELIEECRRRLGVSYRDYRKLELYRLNNAEQRKAYRRLLRRRERRAQELEACKAAAVEAADWTMEEAEEKIKAARRELGIPYRVYQELALWGKEPEEQTAAYLEYKERKAAEADDEAADKNFDEADDSFAEDKE